MVGPPKKNVEFDKRTRLKSWEVTVLRSICFAAAFRYYFATLWTKRFEKIYLSSRGGGGRKILPWAQHIEQLRHARLLIFYRRAFTMNNVDRGYFQKIGGKIDRFPQIVLRELNAIWNCDMKKSMIISRTTHTALPFTAYTSCFYNAIWSTLLYLSQERNVNNCEFHCFRYRRCFVI